MNKNYKFYKYVDVERALKIINDGTLYFNNPLNFNDPFDIAPSTPDEGKSKHYRRIIAAHGLKPKPYGKDKKATLNRANNEIMREAFLRKWSVTCFSDSPFILPMWAHYADNHKGCVIEFIVSEENRRRIENQLDKNHMLDDVLFPLPVVYSKKRPRLYDSDGNTGGEIATQILLTKDKAWSYEQEMRSFKAAPAGAYPFRKEQLNRVICGIKMKKEDISLIQKAIITYQQKNGCAIKLDKAYLDKDAFRMGIL